MKTVTVEAGLDPMPVPRAELKLVRLLSRCEAMAADKRNPDEWRLEKVRRAGWEMTDTGGAFLHDCRQTLDQSVFFPLSLSLSLCMEALSGLLALFNRIATCVILKINELICF